MSFCTYISAIIAFNNGSVNIKQIASAESFAKPFKYLGVKNECILRKSFWK